ncbi:hypothetical protein D3C87_1274120 [compost metagenome]
MEVGAPRCTSMVWCVTSTLGHVYRLDVMPPQFSTYCSMNDVVLIDSCRIDVILPSAPADSRMCCFVSGRCPVVVNICARGTTSFTGRPVIFAAAQAATECGHRNSLAPKPEPMNGASTLTLSGVSPKICASVLR